MDRSAIFVDAGYLLAAGGALTCGTHNRSRFTCGYEKVIAALVAHAAEHGPGLQPLRTYWYDGAPDGVPTPDHLKIGALAYVKVRLGRVIQGEQKGVDALIYRDLMTLARERAITSAYLVSGDEDLREGVVAAQDMGVQVILVGIPTSQRSNQSAALIREVDEHIVLPKEFPGRALHADRRRRRLAHDGRPCDGRRGKRGRRSLRAGMARQRTA